MVVNESTDKLGRLEIQHIDIWYTHCPISQQRYGIVQIDKGKAQIKKNASYHNEKHERS